MSVFDDLLEDAQPGYGPQVKQVLERLMTMLGEPAFEGVDKAGFVARAAELAQSGPLSAQHKAQVVSDLSTIGWWCGLEIADEDHGRLARLARAVYFEQTRTAIDYRRDQTDPAARRAHAVLAGPLVDNAFHSPTRGTFDYVRALAADGENQIIEVWHGGVLSPGLLAYARQSLGPLLERVRFIGVDEDPNYLAAMIGHGARTYHVWCDNPLNINISLLALFGPTLMFTCGDAAPIQFADVYWYAHDPAYIAGLWGRRGAPDAFIANYLQLESAPFPQAGASRARTRAEHGFGADEVVIVTVGNRLGVDMDQAFVDGVAGLVLANPNCRWVIVGALQDFWLGAFTQVLGDQFNHIAFDPDLAGLLALADIFANPFRAGGGNTVITAIDSGAAVLTRDFGDAAAWVPAGLQAADVAGYFSRLQELVEDRALRDAWLAEQRALLARRLDQAAFAEQLKDAVGIAYSRFEARTPGKLAAIFGQAERKLAALRSDPGRPARSKPPRRAPRR